MSYPTFLNPTHVPQDIVHELDAHLAQNTTFLSREHAADGSHSDITADSVSSVAGYTERGRLVPMGTWVDLTWQASDYTANGTMTWPVTAGQQARRRVSLMGKTLSYAAQIVGTNVGGVANTTLRLALPPGMTFPIGGTAADQTLAPFFYSDAGGAVTVGQAVARSGVAYIELGKTTGANWTITAGNNTTIVLWLQMEIA